MPPFKIIHNQISYTSELSSPDGMPRGRVATNHELPVWDGPNRPSKDEVAEIIAAYLAKNRNFRGTQISEWEVLVPSSMAVLQELETVERTNRITKVLSRIGMINPTKDVWQDLEVIPLGIRPNSPRISGVA